MTYGRLRFNLKRRFPSIDLDTIEDTIQYRYQQILDELSWTRQSAPKQFNTVAEVGGTLTATNGSNTVVGDLAVWSPAMNGSFIRIAARGEFYQFSAAPAIPPAPPTFNVGLLDRPFIGDTGTGQSYRINQAYYIIPQALNIVSVRPQDHSDPLEYISREDAGQIYPNRNSYGRPVQWTKLFVDNTDAAIGQVYPIMGIELLPWPTEVRSYSMSVEWDSDPRVGAVVAGAPDTEFLPWVRPATLEHGCCADLERRMKDRAAASDEEALYRQGIETMMRMDLRRRGPSTMRMDPGYVAGIDQDDLEYRHFHR